MRAVIPLLTALLAAAPLTAQSHWVGTWGASPQSAGTSGASLKSITHQTLREIVRVSIGGDTLRLRLSNEFGTTPLRIGAARIALSAGKANIVPGTSRTLTFGGDSGVTIPPGAPVLSDPVALHLAPLADVAISLYFPDSTAATTYHELSRQTSYVSPAGDHTADAAMPVESTSVSWYFIAGLAVRAPAGAVAVVTLGNSITDGAAATVDSQARWPNVLARRLVAAHRDVAVVNEGISGNRVLHDRAGPNALARFDRDVLRQPGVRYVIVLEGINDIGWSFFPDFKDQEVSAADIIAGYRQLIARAHELGLVIYGATLTPFDSCFYFTARGEAKRQAVNQWIRASGMFDGVIDFDEATRDPAHPSRLLPLYDSGDHLHPGDAGYQAMGRAVDLRLFGGR